MGVFNQNCFISGKAIVKNEMALVIVLEDSKYKSHRRNFDFVARALPVVGKYDEYGSVDLNNLSEQKYLIKSLNKSLAKSKDRMGNKFEPLKESDPVNYLWCAINDYDQSVCYVSKKVYDLLPNLVISKEDMKKLKSELADFRKAEQSHLKKIEEYKTTKDKKQKDLLNSLVKLYNSPMILLQGKLLNRMVGGENYYLNYEALREAVKENRDEEIISFYALTQVMSKMGKTFQSATYGSQDTNKAFVVNFHEAIAKALK